MNNLSFPTPNPLSATDAQQLQLIHQIQEHSLSFHQVSLLSIALMLPIPISWKLGFYHFLLSLPLPQLSPLGFILLVTLGPIGLLICLYLLIVLLLRFLRFAILYLVKRISKENNNKVFLELTFPSNTSKSAYATEQLFNLLHAIARQKGFLDKLLDKKEEYSLEIVSTKNEGIRYMLVVNRKDKEVIKRSLISYLPGLKIKEANDYLNSNIFKPSNALGISELRLSHHFALPLKTQKQLDEHDLISYLTGNMTKLKKDELVSFQVVVSPVLSATHKKQYKDINALRSKIYKNQPLTPFLQKNLFNSFTALPGISIVWFLIKTVFNVLKFSIMFVFSMMMAVADSSGKTVPFLQTSQEENFKEILNPYEQELQSVVKKKLDLPLFEASIRLFISAKEPIELQRRLSGLMSSFGPMNSSYQSLITKGTSLFDTFNNRLSWFKNRVLSQNTGKNLFLSVSEISDLYHFPHTNTTRTEDLVKVYSQELPAPLSLKKTKNLDAVFGVNKYGDSVINIGITDEDRSRHVYLLGQTGSGKTTVIFQMAKADIEKGRGVAIIDPHGDLADDLLTTVPLKRTNDLIYLNPFDLKYPVGINLLELTPGLNEDDLELEKELVAESIISIFRRVFSKEEQVDAHRIEYILRNTIYTVFTVENSTLFTIYDILNNPDFRKQVIKNLEDENLKNFWRFEFGKAGDYQVVKMVGGVTAKVGRFLFSPTARRILEQPKSTINFSEILDKKKILICNLSEGKLGEDTMQLLGTTIITKIQQAALRRARINLTQRTPFYLFVDEFQNFATASFNRMLSGGRKFGLRLTIAEQSTSQQNDRSVVNVILANTGTVICFRTASPIDEDLMLAQFSPYIKKGEIANLPRYHFYIKLSAVNPEEPFSGETLPIKTQKDNTRIQNLINASRKNWAMEYKKPAVKKVLEKPVKQSKKSKSKMFIPDEED